MATLSLIFACTTVLLAIFYIRKIKKQLNNVEKAFKELSALYYEEKQEKSVLLDEYWKEHRRLF